MCYVEPGAVQSRGAKGLSHPTRRSHTLLVTAVKHALEKMDRKFLLLSGLIFDEYTHELLRRLGEKEEKLLERPYAYEFYHQMRVLWDSKSDLVAAFADVVIQAEVDKGYQAIQNLDRIPDFLLHRPNSDERNYAVIEFKLAAAWDQAEKDFQKFVSFRNRRGYVHFVEVLIGHTPELQKARAKLVNQQGEHLVEIAVVLFDTDTWRAADITIHRVNPEAH
jgi:hypothetical protein